MPANSTILEKTRDLCGDLLELPEYKSSMKAVEAFLENDEAKAQYRSFADLGEELHQKQHAGSLTDEDIQKYDTAKSDLESNPLIAEFMAAQDGLNDIASTISKHVAKTLELGRVPSPEEMEAECCGNSGCGCN
ncbi:MAG: YlbF family regulator [Verrucomicrobiales bacterium]|nr:YlbF family regulator [Verrucomicrobiales bacterium]